MYKLVVLFALLAVASSGPGGLIASHGLIAEPSLLSIHQPAIARVGNIIESIPTAVSSQSSTIVHNKNFLSPILAPAVRTIHTPILRTSPLIKTISTGPIISSYTAGTLGW